MTFSLHSTESSGETAPYDAAEQRYGTTPQRAAKRAAGALLLGRPEGGGGGPGGADAYLS